MTENFAFSQQSAGDFSELLGKLHQTTALIALQLKDPGLQQTIEILQNLGDRIAVFYARIRKLIQLETGDKKIRFIADYFFKNFAQISENTKASRHIIAYSLKRPAWLKEHSDRIVESLKLLYSDLLTMKIDCEQWYGDLFHAELPYDFGLDFQTELASLDTILDYAAACRVLGVAPGAGREAIKSAFRNAAKKRHPDLNPGADREAFIRLEQAYKKMLAGPNRS